MQDMRPIDISQSRSGVQVINAYLRGVYQWMILGMLVTALGAYAANLVGFEALLYTTTLDPGTGRLVTKSSFVFWGLIIGYLGLGMVLIWKIQSLSSTAATVLFLLFSLVNGLTLSIILLAYTSASIFSTFLICAGMFAAMSIYGLLTKRDLTAWGSFLRMGVFGVLIALVVNLILQSPAFDYVISVIGVLVFTGLTAHDTQRLKEFGEAMPADDATAVRRGTIIGALTLYLDFINMFLFLLRLFGSRR